MTTEDAPDISVLNEQDGADHHRHPARRRRRRNRIGRPTTEFHASPDGTLMRFLTNGHL